MHDMTYDDVYIGDDDYCYKTENPSVWHRFIRYKYNSIITTNVCMFMHAYSIQHWRSSRAHISSFPSQMNQNKCDIFIACVYVMYMNERTNERLNEWMNKMKGQQRVSVLTVTAIDMLPNTQWTCSTWQKVIFSQKKMSQTNERTNENYAMLKSPLIVCSGKCGAWLIINVRCVENRYKNLYGCESECVYVCGSVRFGSAHIGNMASSSFYRVLSSILTHLFTR